MTAVYKDRVAQTSTTTGTGAYSLSGSVSAFRDFDEVGNGKTCHYLALMGTDWEVGLGTVTVGSPNTLARTSILSSSNANAAVSWGAGTKTISLILPADAIGYPITAAEIAAGVTPAAYQYQPGDVRRYGADDTGVADSSVAFQDAVDSLPNGRGTVTGSGAFRLDSPVVIDTNRVYFEFTQDTTITAYGARAFAWIALSAASPGEFGGIRGGRIFAGDTTATELIYAANWLRLTLDTMVLYSCYTEADGAGTRAGFRGVYGFGHQFRHVYVNRCDYGYHIKEDATVAYRSTSTAWLGGYVSRCRYGMYLVDLAGFEISAQTTLENNSIGVYLHGEENNAAIPNCQSGLIRAYFERNGKHIRIEGNGDSRCRGIQVDGSFLESIQANYTGSATPYPDTGGADKVELIKADRISIRDCFWQSTGSGSDITIDANSADNVIGWQARNYASISDLSDSTVYERAWTESGALPTGDTTPSVKGIHVATVTNASPVTITQFDDGFAGQIIHLVPQDGNTTINHDGTGAGIRLMGAANKPLSAGQTISFVCIGSDIWHQLSVPNALTAYAYTPTNVVADRSYDANSTTLEELADVLGTLITDLQARGILQ